MNFKKIAIAVALLFPIGVSATTLSVTRANVDFHWSVDNSKFGGLKEQSRIEWKSHPIIITVSNKFSFGELGIFGGMDTNAKFIDNDWCRSNDGVHCSNFNPVVGGNKTVNYSSDSAKSSMSRVGAYFSGTVYVFGSVLGFDSVSIKNKATLYVDSYEAKGLYSNRYNLRKFGESVVSNRTQKYVFDNVYGLNAKKTIHGFQFNLMPFVGVYNMYVVDHHVLRRDVKNLRFTLLDSAIKYGAKVSVGHRVGLFDVTAGASYSTYKGLIAKALIEKGDNMKNIGIGAGDRGGEETSFFINASYDFK